ncbi:hypothetical protein NL676_025308 [Syzygium grande]|nr:hypothetical protein NL676_025308 [Syzygium grande]
MRTSPTQLVEMLNWKDPREEEIRWSFVEILLKFAGKKHFSAPRRFAPSSMAFVMFVEWYLVRDGARNRWPFFLAIADSVLFDLHVSKHNAIADNEGTHHLTLSIVCFVVAMLYGLVELRFGNLEFVSPLFAASVDVER